MRSLRTMTVALGLVMLGAGAAPREAGAQGLVLCKKPNAVLTARVRCRGNERQLGLPPGPKGDKGDQGPQGIPGSQGIPGAAVAFARINSSGGVDLANSKNITGANVMLGGFLGTFCFTGLTFPFKNVIAVIDYADNTADNTAIVQATLGDPFLNCTGVSGTQAEVATADSVGFRNHGFFVIFN